MVVELQHDERAQPAICAVSRDCENVNLTRVSIAWN